MARAECKASLLVLLRRWPTYAKLVRAEYKPSLLVLVRRRPTYAKLVRAEYKASLLVLVRRRPTYAKLAQAECKASLLVLVRRRPTYAKIAHFFDSFCLSNRFSTNSFIIAQLVITSALPIGYKNKFSMLCGQPSLSNKSHEDMSVNNLSTNALQTH